MGSPANAFKLGSGLVSAGVSLFGGNRVPNTFVPQINPYAFNPYSVNIAQPALDLQANAVENQAQALEQQGQLAIDEAQMNAQQTAFQAHQFRENQANAYNGSGILLEGSPMLVLDQTRQLAQQQINQIMKQGAAYNDLALRQAMITRNQGRAAILGQQAQFDSQAMQFGAQSDAFNAEQNQARILAQPIQQSGLANALSSVGDLLNLFSGKTATGSKRTTAGFTDPLVGPSPSTTIHGTIPQVAPQASYNFQPWQM